jgi:hypothetical protein
MKSLNPDPMRIRIQNRPFCYKIVKMYSNVQYFLPRDPDKDPQPSFQEYVSGFAGLQDISGLVFSGFKQKRWRISD